MPITQDRMIQLLNAARDWEHAAQLCRRHLVLEYKRFKDGMLTAEQALESIYTLDVPEYRLDDFRLTVRTIDAEAVHFRKFARINDSAKRRQAAQRSGEAPQKPSILRRSTAPRAHEADEFHGRARGNLSMEKQAEINEYIRKQAEAEEQELAQMSPEQRAAFEGTDTDTDGLEF